MTNDRSILLIIHYNNHVELSTDFSGSGWYLAELPMEHNAKVD